MSKKTTVKIGEDVPEENLRKFAAKVIYQAMGDVKWSTKLERCLEALFWLTGDDIGMWLEWAQMESDSAWRLLTDGNLRKMTRNDWKGYIV